MIPTICFINKATVGLGVPYMALAAACQKYVDAYLVPIWNTPAHIVLRDKARDGEWPFLFCDNADAPGALGYHEDSGLPDAKVFVKTTLDDGQLISVTATHELTEMLADPNCSKVARGPHGYDYAYETADAVEETDFEIDGIRCSNFVYPAWFTMHRHPLGTQFDHLNKCKRAFELLPGGYISYRTPSGRWHQKFGSHEKAMRFAKEDRRGHRSEIRAAQTIGPISPNGAYSAVCTQVHDGDTAHFDVDSAKLLGVRVLADIRFHRINAPELSTPQGQTAAQFVTQTLLGKPVTLVLHGADKYGGRIDGEVWYKDANGEDKNISDVMLGLGLAVPMK